MCKHSCLPVHDEVEEKNLNKTEKKEFDTHFLP